MSNQLFDLLKAWKHGSSDADWVLGTVYKTQGSAYRKAGAIMLINSQGEYYGMLSGGCLEADIVRNARKVMFSNKPLLLEYDSTDEDDWSYQLNIGCGGKIYITLQHITVDNDLGLGDMFRSLNERESGYYHQKIGHNTAYFETASDKGHEMAAIDIRDKQEWLVTPIAPAPHLLIVGSGNDVKPLVAMASVLGWCVTIVDPRSATNDSLYSQKIFKYLKTLDESLQDYMKINKVDALVLMSHNVDIDADGLRYGLTADPKYVAILGPQHRTKNVVNRAGLNEGGQQSLNISTPAGLDIGAKLPETIALSILAECQSVLSSYSTK